MNKRIIAETETEFKRLCKEGRKDWRRLVSSAAPERANSLIIIHAWDCKKCGSSCTSFLAFPEPEGPMSSHEAMRLAQSATVGACSVCLDRWASDLAGRLWK